MTPYQTAQRLIRGRNGTTSHPDFVIAYLQVEADAVGGDPLLLLPVEEEEEEHLMSMDEVVDAMRRIGEEVGKAMKSLSKAFDRMPWDVPPVTEYPRIPALATEDW